jgi:hypothetical protein
VFQPASNEAAALLAACKLFGQYILWRAKQDGVPICAPQVADYIFNWPDFDKIAGAMLELVDADAETQARVLRFDPRAATTQMLAESYQRVVAKNDTAA